MLHLQFDESLLYYGMIYTGYILLVTFFILLLWMVYQDGKFKDGVVKELKRLKLEKADLDNFEDLPYFQWEKSLEPREPYNFSPSDITNSTIKQVFHE